MFYDRTLRLMELAINTPLQLSPPYSYRAEYLAVSTNTAYSTTGTQITASLAVSEWSYYIVVQR